MMIAALLVLAGGITATVLAGGAGKSASGSLAVSDLDAGEGLVADEPGTPVESQPAADAGAAEPDLLGKPDRPEPTQSPKPVHKKSTKPVARHSELDKKDGEVDQKSADATSDSRGSGVTIIETGNRHKDQQIHLAPDFNPKSFDSAAYVGKARKLAKKIYSDAYLVTFDAAGVAPSGHINLPLANFEVTYKFLSPSHAKRTKPIGVDEDRPCWVYVEVNKKGTTARIVEWDECKGKARPNPRCSLKEVWDRAYQFGAPKSGAVASIDYLWDGWFFDIDALGFTESIPDDC